MSPQSSHQNRARLRRTSKLKAIATREVHVKVRAIRIRGLDHLIGLPFRMPCPKGHMKSFSVELNACMSQQEIADRIEKAFGDLNGKH